MALKQVSFKTVGMQRDKSVSAFNSEYSYENMNMRIMATDDNTLMSLVNEKGNLESEIDGIQDGISGIPVGQATIDHELVLFTTGIQSRGDINVEESDVDTINAVEEDADIQATDIDKIYKLWFKDNKLKGQLLYEGNLGFDYSKPLETLTFYENDELKKVYWVDGLNQPRLINVAATDEVRSKWRETAFDFVKKISLKETINVTRDSLATGALFAPGVIQYAFTYFNKYGQETNIFNVSPLLYLSYSNRGASPDDKVSNSFKITIKNMDTSFDYLRIYSIHRSSLDATPTVKKVVDIDINSVLEENDSSHNYTVAEKLSVDNIYLVGRANVGCKIDDFTDGMVEAKIEHDDYTEYIVRNAVVDYIRVYGDNSSDTIFTLQNIDARTFVYVYKDGTINIYSNYDFTVSSYNRVISYTDTNTTGETVDPTELLYVGGEEIIASTLSQKDNTLFLGDITLNRKMISSTIKNTLRNGDIKFDYGKTITPPNPSGTYPFESQLQYDSQKIKTFKYLETYRFGIQAQHYTGKWSEPIWINDVRNDKHISTVFYNNSDIKYPVAKYTLDNQDVINELLDKGYVRIRPVIVYPNINERECICQGVLCPTVYNVADRYSNTPFAQASWFVRPNAPFDIDKADTDTIPFGYSSGSDKVNSRHGVLNNSITNPEEEASYTADNNYLRGSWTEFRHNYPIPKNTLRNAEIQCIDSTQDCVILDSVEASEFASNWQELYYVDQSIVTMHSPDIEFDDSIKTLDSSNLKLRIVGIVPLTSFASDIDITTSTPVLNYYDSTDMPPGFRRENYTIENNFTASFNSKDYGDSYFGWRGLVSGVFWLDTMVSGKKNEVPSKMTSSLGPLGYVVYPWHRNGSLNNTRAAIDSYRSAMLEHKKMSNHRFSYKPIYLEAEDIWEAYKEDDNNETGISGVTLFNSEEMTLVRIPAPKNSSLNDMNYYGNISKVLVYGRNGSSAKKNGYGITISKGLYGDNIQNITGNTYRWITNSDIKNPEDNPAEAQIKSTDAISMKYKSTPHFVLALNYDKQGKQRVLPTIYDSNKYDSSTPWAINSVATTTDYENKHPFWDSKAVGISQDVISLESDNYAHEIGTMGGIQYGFLWLGELYNDSVSNRFGGTTEEAFENNTWTACGNIVSLTDDYNNAKTSITVTWEEGDTFFQRYDHIKTYPYTLEDQNSITDIVSFMCESRVNLDGRYDRNRGQTNNLSLTPENFNKMNDVYSQSNNFFTFRTINANRLNLDNFKNTITWTKTKTAGELVDTWTNITMASTLDLDGNKGGVTAIRRFNNNLLAFQPKGISQILYNENMQIASTEGVPIEIANSGKVNGKRYITNEVGCTNKWSICETPKGLYFIDDLGKKIYLYNGQFSNIGDEKGFHSFINKTANSISTWNPVDFNNFVTYYDNVNDDVLFINNDYCLAYSESLGQFSSFYSYESTPYISTLDNHNIAVNVEKGDSKQKGVYKIWLQNEGDYNMYFNKFAPFYTTVIANPDMTKDKVFTNIEFRSDTWNNNNDLLHNTTFDTLNVWNEYQKGLVKLVDSHDRPSNIKKKFRIWRADIPRNLGSRDRIRNPWAYIKLSMEKENTNKTILHDLVVQYIE